MICESYYEAIRTATPEPDRGDRHGPARPAQRGLAQLLIERLKDKIDDRLRHRAPPVHAGLRAALEGLTTWRAARDLAPAGGAVRLRA